ncbi:hypothetical protein D3C83_198930 [compost metagenome]
MLDTTIGKNDSRNTSRHSDNTGARRLNPAKLSMESLPVASSTTCTTPNAPSVVTA